MNKIEANAKFRELLKTFNEAPKVAPKDPKVAAVGRRKEQENNANPDLADVPLSVRKPKRQLKAPGRYDASPVPRPKPKQVSPKLRTNLLVRQNQNASPRIARKPAGPASPPGRIARHPNPDLQMRQANQTDMVQPSEDSDDNISESASAVQSPPRGSAFSRVVPTHKKQPSPHEPWNDSQFVQPPARASRDPRIRNTNLNQIPMQPQSQYDNIASTSRSSNNLRRRPAQKPETSLRQPQLFQSSMRHIVREQSMSHSNREPYVRLTDCQPRGGALHLGDGFQRPQTPPEVRDMASIAKSALREAINKLIDCPHVNALECIYIINSTQDAVVAMIDKLRRRRERTESILRSDSLMKTQDINTSNHRVHAWLDTVASSRIGGNQESCYRTTSVPKRQKLDSQYVYSRLNHY